MDNWDRSWCQNPILARDGVYLSSIGLAAFAASYESEIGTLRIFFALGGNTDLGSERIRRKISIESYSLGSADTVNRNKITNFDKKSVLMLLILMMSSEFILRTVR